MHISKIYKTGGLLSWKVNATGFETKLQTNDVLLYVTRNVCLSVIFATEQLHPFSHLEEIENMNF